MARRFRGDRLLVASHNPGKIKEIRALLAPFAVRPVNAAELDLPEPVEDGDSFTDNALIKARAGTAASGLPGLGDDSGLAVAGLAGLPGIYSARWAGPDRDFSHAMARVEKELDGKADRSASFVCALALAWPDGHVEVFEGRATGQLVWPPRGRHGFGYDPIFVPDSRDDGLTFGEIPADEKHQISHRADAFRQLVAACFAG